MQQTLSGCAFCDAPPGSETGDAHTWGADERITHAICVDCAIQEQADPWTEITMPVTAVASSSTCLQRSPDSVWNSGTSRGCYTLCLL